MKDIREVVAEPRKIALYANLEIEGYYAIFKVDYSAFDEHYMPLPVGQFREQTLTGFVRVSEPIEVRFEAIANDEMVAKAVESLNEQERKIIEELNQKLANLREKKSQLLALTHQTESA